MAGEEITIDNLRQLLAIQTELRELAELRWQKAQRALVSLLETFAPEEVDRRLKNGQLLDNLPIEELEEVARRNLTIRVNRANPHKDAQTLQVELQKKQEELNTLQQENRRLTDRMTELEEENKNLQNQLIALQQVAASTANPTGSSHSSSAPESETKSSSQPPEPDWMTSWRQTETFERDSSILAMIGESGFARRPIIEAKAAEMLGIKKAGGSIQALLSRLAALGVIEIYRPWDTEGAGSGGRLPDLLRLKERGETAFWLLTGKQASANEFELLLPRHVSHEHTLLNLQATDMLREVGYQVNLTPPDIQLPDGGVFLPDLVLHDQNGQVHFVEVEREANKDREQRQAKWRNFFQASGGRMYVVCDNRTCMRSIRSEINYTLGSMKTMISLTNLADLQAGKRGEGDSIWLEVRNRR